MNKFIGITLLMCSTTMILAIRPDWYPENAAEIEANCVEENELDPETKAKMFRFQMEDTPAVRATLFCLIQRKHIYRPEVGFDAERIRLGLTQVVKLDCKLESVYDCAKQHNDSPSLEKLYFSVFKCLSDNRELYCKNLA